MDERYNNAKHESLSPDKEKECVSEFLLDAIACCTEDDRVDADRLSRYIRNRLEDGFMDGVGYFPQFLQDVAGTSSEQKSSAVAQLAEGIYQQRTASYSDYAEFEFALRKRMNRANGFDPLTQNQTFACEIDGDQIYIHLAPSYSVANKRDELKEAFSRLASILQTDEYAFVNTIQTESHLTLFRPKLLKLLGFEIDQSKSARASMTKQEFIKRWKSGT